METLVVLEEWYGQAVKKLVCNCSLVVISGTVSVMNGGCETGGRSLEIPHSEVAPV